MTGLALPSMAALIPVVSIPSAVLAMFPTQKLINETLYKSYPDLMLVTQKGKTVKIHEDETRLDIIKELRGLDNTQKAGFLSLQTIVGLTKMGELDKSGEPLTFETTTHGVVRRTLKALSELGYIENYKEEPKNKSHLFIEKIAFGNIANLGRKSQKYNIKFQRTEKEIGLEELKESGAFPEIFGTEEKQGLLDKRNYIIKSNADGSLSIEYPKREKQSGLSDEQISEEKTESEKEKFRRELSQGVPSLEEQNSNSRKAQEIYQEKSQETRGTDFLSK